MATLAAPPIDNYTTTSFERKLRRCPDFLTAVRRLGVQCGEVAAFHARQHREEPGSLCDLAFWPACGQDAQDVADLVEQMQADHPDDWKPRVLDVLRRAGLCDFYAALEEDTGAAYAEYFGF